MRLIVKNNFMSIRGSSVVLDESNNEVYTVKGKLLSISKKKRIYDQNGNKLFTVRNKIWHILTNKALIYDGNGHKIGKLVNRLSRRAAYVLEGYQDEIRIGREKGDRFLKVFKNDQEVAQIRGVGIVQDIFELDCFIEDTALLVALVIGIDNIIDNSFND